MGGTTWGVLGAIVGGGGGGVAAITAHIRSRRGPADASETQVGFRDIFRPDGIERYIYVQAAAWSFLVVVVAVVVIGALNAAFDWTNVGHWVFGALLGVGGAAFGTGSAIIARRTA